ncbi:DUF1636 domain-containing protein [Ahrensia sp. R2A130]|uniref:DUF1636 family protein n=1 Tax=Ahrensia sp. R2A130 TaxID=744979 RepID=UPI0001E0C327|nr:DUF1636 domain-containing protein [Ahrensia sp. R2A130]EFL90799.1 conserved hypothetical protein [Ahrensia sp. R2A130]
MSHRPRHKITVCVSCRHKNSECRPGLALIEKLRSAIDVASDVVGDDFAVSGVACMAGCDRPCTVAYQASSKTTYLFGDIDADADIDDLVAFARQYNDLSDGWSSATKRPVGLAEKTLARIPAAILATHVTEELLQ